MALFSQKKKTEKKVMSKKEVSAADKVVARDLSSVILIPRVTEKAMKQSEKNVYVFKVAANATKTDVSLAVKQHFGVTPVKVNIVNKTPRQYKHAGTRRLRTERGMRKAYVYLKKGDSISLV